MKVWTLLGGLLLALCGPVVLAQDGPLPQGPHVDLVYAKCQSCHNLKYVTDSKGLPPFLWEDTVDLMVQLGMQVTDEEKENLIAYLSSYMGPNPPPESAEAPSGGGESGGGESGPPDDTSAADAEERAEEADGQALYESNCSSCHQSDGQGVAGVFPPLVGHLPDLYGADGGRDYLVTLLLYGLRGEIRVDGESYDGVMPAWGHLDDAELAAILNYALTAWGNEASLPDDFAPYEAADVAAGRGRGWSAQDVLERRPEGAAE